MLSWRIPPTTGGGHSLLHKPKQKSCKAGDIFFGAFGKVTKPNERNGKRQTWLNHCADDDEALVRGRIHGTTVATWVHTCVPLLALLCSSSQSRNPYLRVPLRNGSLAGMWSFFFATEESRQNSHSHARPIGVATSSH